MIMKILVTGANGFVGRYLVEECLRCGWDVIRQDASPGQNTHCFDICDSDSLRVLLRDHRPDACIHLAAISYVPDGATMAKKMCSVNIMGTVGLLEAFRTELPSAKILVVSSANIYQTVALEGNSDSKVHFGSANVYSITKLAADLIALNYATEHDMDTITVRPVNHIGPGQSDRFVVASFVRQLKAIARGCAEDEIRVGNLASRRDFLDVRDVVRGYRLLLEKGHSGRHYDLASGNLVTIEDLLSELCRIAGVVPRIVPDPELYRPTDSSPSLDSNSMRRDTGWKAGVDLKTTLKDMYNATEVESE